MVPKEVGYINEVLTKRSLRDIIAVVMKKAGADKVANFLDDIKDMGYRMAFQGGLSFNLDAVIIPEEKEKLVQEGYERADAIMDDYNMGLITNNERYNQIIDVWTNINTKLTKAVIDTLIKDDDGFNPVYMMLDSGARGSKEQIRQLSGMRGLMAKPQKSGVEGGQQVIENPILSNFKEGLSVLEYFISTHGARKGLADTALKTADAGYLTRRLVDVAQDVIINEEDCGTLRGLTATAIKRNDDVVQTLYDRILGRVALNDVIHPLTGEVHLQGRRGDHRVDRRGHREIAAGVGGDPFGADLRVAPRRLREVLRPQPGYGPHGPEGRGRRRHRRAVDRRAGYAADPPYVPRRRCGRRHGCRDQRRFEIRRPSGDRRAAHRQGQERRRRGDRHRDLAPVGVPHRRSRRPRSYSIRTTCPTARRSSWRTAPRSRRAT